MNTLRHRKGCSALAISATVLWGLSLPAFSLIEYTDAQRDTIVEIVEQLQDRHYAKLTYNDTLSSEHLDSYINSLDRSKLFFMASDIAEFEQYRTVMDDQLGEGKLDAGFSIFNVYQKRLQDRLEKVIKSLPETAAAMDFSVNESIPFEEKDLPWAKDTAEMDERWRKQLKNQVLNLKLADKPADEIVPTLEKRYRSQLNSVPCPRYVSRRPSAVT